MVDRRLRTPQDLGATVREGRRAQGLTQAELARAAGVSREWLIGVEQGRRPRAELEKVLAVLNTLELTLTAGSSPATTGMPPVGIASVSITERATREAITATREPPTTGRSAAEQLITEHGQRAARLLDTGMDPSLARYLTRLSLDLAPPIASSPGEEAP